MHKIKNFIELLPNAKPLSQLSLTAPLPCRGAQCRNVILGDAKENICYLGNSQLVPRS